MTRWPDDVTSLERFLRTRLAQDLPGAAVQRRFAPSPARKGWQPDDQPATARRAAALVLIYPGDEGLTLPLTRRHDDLPHHPGQISLPGGRVNPGEPADRAALRETHEEIGVHPERVRLIGPLSSLWVIVSNHVVQPFIAVTDERPDFRLAASEVEALVEVPLTHLHDVDRLKWDRRTREAIVIDYPYFDLLGHRVWGATAMILGEFAALIDPDIGPAPVPR